MKETRRSLKAAVRQEGRALHIAGAVLLKAKDVVAVAVRQVGLALDLFDSAMQQDKEVGIAAFRKNS